MPKADQRLLPQRKVGQTVLSVDTLGFGGAPIGNLYQPMSNHDAADVLQTAWDSGFRYFDTAPHYGQGLSERRTGDMLRPLTDSDYVLSTKVGRLLKPAGYSAERHGFCSPMPFDFYYDYSYNGIMRSFEDSLMRLGLDRINILYMHDIGRMTHGEAHDHHFKIAMDSGYKAMDSLREQGLVQAIGLGVNEFQVCEDAMQYGSWDCFLLAGRYSLLEQKSLQTFLPKCEEHNCSAIIGGPYNSGILATGALGNPSPRYNYQPANEDIIQHVANIEISCAYYKVSLAAAALQFPLAHPAVASVIPGIDSKARVKETLDLLSESIPNEFWLDLKEKSLIHEDAPVPNRVIGD